jgi:hypothetical protein
MMLSVPNSPLISAVDFFFVCVRVITIRFRHISDVS